MNTNNTNANAVTGQHRKKTPAMVSAIKMMIAHLPSSKVCTVNIIYLVILTELVAPTRGFYKSRIATASISTSTSFGSRVT